MANLQNNPYSQMNAVQQFLNGVYQGGNQMGAGVAQLGIGGLNSLGVMGPDAVQRNQQIIAQQAQERAQNSSFSGRMGQMAGRNLTTLPIPVHIPLGGLPGMIANTAVNDSVNSALQPSGPQNSRLDNVKAGLERAPGLLNWISMYNGG